VDTRLSPADDVLGIGEEGEDGVRGAYPPATLKRLAQVKRRYDPDNLFHLNLNVAPATLPGQRRRREAQ
jgi:hypothetical protein